MTTETAPTLREFAMLRLSMAASKRTRRASKARTVNVNAVLVNTVRVMLHLAGFASLTLAGFQWNMIAGMIVAGVSCFALSTLLTRGTTDEMEAPTQPDIRPQRR